MPINKHIKPVYLSDEEKIMWDRLEKERSYRWQEFVRMTLKEAYFKAFPPYKKSSRTPTPEEEGMTDGDYCERILEGTIEEGLEGPICRIQYGGWDKQIPLNTVKEYKTKEEV